MKAGLYAAGIAAFAMTACGGSPKHGYYANNNGGSNYKTTSSRGGSADSAEAGTNSSPRITSSPTSGAYSRPSRSSSRAHVRTSPPPPRHRRVRRIERRQRVVHQRPGLGTVFGETVSSRVSTRPFVRKASRPFATAAMHYNDTQGVHAHAAYRGGARPIPIYAYTPRNEITISLVDQYGRVLPGLKAGGRTLVMGQAGQRYKIVIQNKTNGRFEVVASVDGLDVVDGRPADVNKRGYILPPFGRVVVDGFRRSDNYVAAFRFGSVRNSYASRKGKGRNVGVIGVALFDERGSVWTVGELRRRDTANPFPGDRHYARPPR